MNIYKCIFCGQYMEKKVLLELQEKLFTYLENYGSHAHSPGRITGKYFCKIKIISLENIIQFTAGHFFKL